MFKPKRYSKPIYDKNTCGYLIKEAVDAKKCASILGIQYNNSNRNVNDLMISLQNIINKIQQIVCSSQLKYKLIDSIHNMKYDESVRSSDEVLKQMKQELHNLVFKSDRSLGIPDDQLFELRDVMAMLIGTIVSVSSVDGKISINNVKNLWISILDSVCLDYKAPERMAPRIIVQQANEQAIANEQNMMKMNEAITLEQAREPIKKEMKEIWVKFQQETDPVKKDELFKAHIKLLGKDMAMANKENMMKMNQAITLEQDREQIKKEMKENMNKFQQETDPIKKEALFKAHNELIRKDVAIFKQQLDAKKAAGESGKISSMSTFGSTSGSMMWIFVLIIVAVVGYIIYKNKNKLKMPSLSRQISNFGRQIKAVRRM